MMERPTFCYAEIRDNLEKNEDYKKGSANRILFADEPEFHEKIFPAVPLKMEVKIFDSAGKEVQLDSDH